MPYVQLCNIAGLLLVEAGYVCQLKMLPGKFALQWQHWGDFNAEGPRWRHKHSGVHHGWSPLSQQQLPLQQGHMLGCLDHLLIYAVLRGYSHRTLPTCSCFGGKGHVGGGALGVVGMVLLSCSICWVIQRLQPSAEPN